jgi:acetyl esterase/lipase
MLIRHSAETYAVHDPKSELFSPLLWPSGHADLPPTYIQVCGRDPSRDDGLIWERALRARGVPTKIDAYPGCPHAFDVLWPHMAQAGKFNEDRENGYAWLLKG